MKHTMFTLTHLPNVKIDERRKMALSNSVIAENATQSSLANVHRSGNKQSRSMCETVGITCEIFLSLLSHLIQSGMDVQVEDLVGEND
jgi:hypothetical protein